ncbi:MAG TPA: urea ABC transporter permease subunit UrtB [Polyangiaceae bacterium]|nr:urea ABC transporter permease subunit UrtB [Polyangiaceae bacterium]
MDPTARRGIRWASSFLLAWLCLFAPWTISAAGAAVDLAAELRIVAGDDSEKAAQAVERLKGAGDASALPALQALDDGSLQVDAGGNLFIKSKGGLKPAAPGGAAAPTGALKTLEPDNTLRRALLPALAALKLTSPDSDVRLAAAEELAKRPSDDVAPMVKSALAKESDKKVKTALNLVIAQLDLASEDPARRIHALGLIRESGNVDFKADLERMIGKDGNAPSEKDPKVRDAASAALSSIETRVLLVGMVGHLFYGVSLGSVLLLAALGLAITFGLMRVINMAHGEMLMLGAYTTFVVQNFFQKHMPGAFDWYLVAAIPAAFCVCYVIGALLERSVIQFLYGRPLETLLATWGISLGLIQTVRVIFGAQNVTVANPSWLSGGYQLLPGIVLTYSRIAVILFAIVVVAFVWLWMNKTPVGLRVRAVTQNREMAAAMGIPTKRVDLGTFGLGSGIAGLGGVALSQLGNVGPELGQGYIVDSFMVVVLGGVGKIVGTIAGALGLGIVNKLLEPAAGAVLGKIIILGLIILFIQKRPQGIFALKGRAAEAG